MLDRIKDNRARGADFVRGNMDFMKTEERRILYNGVWTGVDRRMDADWRFAEIRRTRFIRIIH